MGESVPRNFMSMKFKARGAGVGVSVVSANSPYARTMPASKSISHVPSALASVASIEDLGQASKSPLPGENLPEHHFKKRYFVENSNKSPIHSSPSPRSYNKRSNYFFLLSITLPTKTNIMNCR